MVKEKDIILSGYHLQWISDRIKGGAASGKVSLDLGISESEFTFDKKEVSFPGYDATLDSSVIKKILRKRSRSDCFLLRGNSLPVWIYLFSDEHGVVKLYEPKMDWPPTLFINGSYMHTVGASKPTEEAFKKANSLKGINGVVFETGFGLGYSSIWLRKFGAKRVVACEISPDVLEVARLNPWSREAFTDKSIELNIADVAEFIKTLPSSSMDGILHDPPNFNKFEYLYSAAFYADAYRVLRPGGRMYHFIGTKNSENARIYNNVAKNMRASGFSRISPSYRGIIASK